MTERERQMIEAYLPHDPDPTLSKPFGYYVKDAAGRTRKCIVRDIVPGDIGGETEYIMYEESTWRQVRPWYGVDDPLRGHKLCDMYDNREDCKDDTHPCYSGWERLREMQRSERTSRDAIYSR